MVRYLIWLLLAAWFAMQIGGLRSPLEREIYAQVRALARFSVDLSPDREMLAGEFPDNQPIAAPRRPGVAVVALPFYLLGQLVGGRPDDPLSLPAQVTSLAAPVAMALAVLLLMLGSLSLGLRRWSSLTMTILVAAATPALLYGGRLAPPAFGLLALSLLLYGLLRVEQKDERISLRLMIGAGLGLMLLLGDELLLVVAAFFLLWALMRARDILHRPSYLLAFLLPLSLAAALFVLHNQAAYGDWFSAPDGQPMWRYLWQTYYHHTIWSSTDLWGRHLWPGLKFLLFSDGPMPVQMAMARDLPAELRNVIFLGIFTWCPLLLIGFIGGWVLSRDPDARGPLMLFILLFLLAVVLRAMAKQIAPVDGYDAAVTLPFWIPWFLGLGFFVEYHLLSMRGKILRTILAVAMLCCLVLSLANAAMDAAEAHVGPAPQRVANLVAAPVEKLPEDLGGQGYVADRLPIVQRDAFFRQTERFSDWVMRAPRQVEATLFPGINNLPLFLPILAVLGVLPYLFGWVVSLSAVRSGRRREDEARVERRRPATYKEEEESEEELDEEPDEPDDDWYDFEADDDEEE
ncbi:MAG: hypothetical protein ACTSXZ_00595 [Alphaproteobacteria bacterium]